MSWPCFPCLTGNGTASTQKNGMQPGLRQTWCIPPKADADVVSHMEDVLQTYQRPYDPQFPVVCMDEASKQLIADIAVPLPTKPGYAKGVDYAYERKGVCTQFVLCDPLRGWRHVHGTQRHTQRDW